ncbi:MAG: hypothetical protein ACRDD0_01595 [Bacteroidales bacterium]
MKYINKNNPNNKEIANSVVNNFIINQRGLGKQCKYFLFTATNYKNQLRDVLIDEQNALCCYCMRRLFKDETTTLEHIIPKSSDQDQLNSYKADYPNFFNEVVHLDLFVDTSPFPPYPHSVAYQNLSASCNGILEGGDDSSCCCNNKRGNKVIYPLFLDPNIAISIKYTKLGIIISSPNNPTFEKTITNLDLNYRTLVEIRFLWSAIANKLPDREVFNNKREISKSVFETDLLSEITEPYKKYFTNEYYWNLLLSYDWFYFYYINKF